jgi:glutamine synthetase
MDGKKAIELGKTNGAVMVDLKFIDLIGKWQHTSVPFHRLAPEAFDEGFGFDGSSISSVTSLAFLIQQDVEVVHEFRQHDGVATVKVK